MNLNFLLPKQPLFYKYFQEQGEQVEAIADLLLQLSNEYTDFKEFARKADRIEHQADDITKKIINRLNHAVITPIDREDIHLIARKTDMVVDLAENIISNICLYQLADKKYGVSEFAEIIHQSANHVAKLLDHLKSQKYTPAFQETVDKIHQLEGEGDKIFEKSILKLFDEEKDPLQVIKWKDILEDLELVTDLCKNLSSIIEGVVIKSS
jgi:uncharacterized protein